MPPGHMNAHFVIEQRVKPDKASGDPSHDQWVAVGEWWANMVPEGTNKTDAPDQVVALSRFICRGKYKRILRHNHRLSLKGQTYYIDGPPKHYGRGNSEMTEVSIDLRA